MTLPGNHLRDNRFMTPKRTITPLPKVKNIIKAGALLHAADKHFADLMKDAGFPSGYAHVYVHDDLDVSISLHTGGEKAFLHPTGKRLYASSNHSSFPSAEAEITEIKTWKASKK